MFQVFIMGIFLGALGGYAWGYEDAEFGHHLGARTCTTLPDKTIHCWSTIKVQP